MGILGTIGLLEKAGNYLKKQNEKQQRINTEKRYSKLSSAMKKEYPEIYTDQRPFSEQVQSYYELKHLEYMKSQQRLNNIFSLAILVLTLTQILISAKILYPFI